MMYQRFPQMPLMPQEEEVPEGLQALMVLQQTAAPMGPAGPTVASQMMQRARPPGPPGMPPGPPQGMPPQGPPQGPPGMMPSDPFRQQMMKTVQQQAQASAQPQQPPQPPGPPQGMAHGGIASLRADNIARMKYAQGGVIGFNGEENSLVNDAEVERILKKGPYVRTPEENEILRKAGYELTQRQPAPEGSAIYRINEMLSRPFIREAITAGAHTLSPQDLAARGDAGALTEKLFRFFGGSQTQPAGFSGRPAEAMTPQQIEASALVQDALRREDIPTQGMVVATPGGRARQSSFAPSAAQATQAAPTTTRPAVTDIPINTDLAEVRRLRDSPFAEVAPTPESQMELLNKFRTAQGQTGPVGSAIEAAIKANAERAAATEAAYRKGQEGQGLESLIAALSAGRRGVGALGEQYVKGQEAQRTAEMSFRQLMDASAAKRDEMAVTLQNMREAAASGNMGAYNTAKTEYDRARRQAADTQRQLAAKAAELSVGSQEKALDRAAHEKIELMRRQTQMMKSNEQKIIENIVNLQLQNLPNGGTPQQQLEAWTTALQTVRGAGRAETVEMQNRKAALDALNKWEALNKQQALINPEQYKRDLEVKLKQIFEMFGVDLPSGDITPAVNTPGGPKVKVTPIG